MDASFAEIISFQDQELEICQSNLQTYNNNDYRYILSPQLHLVKHYPIQTIINLIDKLFRLCQSVAGVSHPSHRSTIPSNDVYRICEVLKLKQVSTWS